MRSFHGIKPQDVLVLLKLVATPDLNQKELALSLKISPSEVSHGLKRLKFSKLLTGDGLVSKESCIEFLIHGLKYVFPPEFGPNSIGIPTSFARPGFKFVNYKRNDIYVWPYPEGEVKGATLRPLYPTLPEACLNDEKLYTLSSLVEMVRSGRAREQEIASKEIKKFIKGKSD